MKNLKTYCKELFDSLGGVVGLSGDLRKRDNSPVPLSEVELLEIEKTIGAQLPGDYREFLATIGGIYFYEPTCVTPMEVRESWGDFETVSTLFGSRKEDRFSLLSEYEDWRDEIPSCMIPIGTDGQVGGKICVGVTGKHKGKIYFWDVETSEDKESFANITLIAKSFDDFLHRLKLNPTYLEEYDGPKYNIDQVDPESVLTQSVESRKIIEGPRHDPEPTRDIKELCQEKFQQLGGVHGHAGKKFPPISMTEEEVREIEDDIEDSLPRMYRDFLLKVGGVVFVSRNIAIRTVDRNSRQDGILIKNLRGSKRDTNGSLLDLVWSSKEFIPSSLMAIGECLRGGWDYFCIGTQGETRGKVYWSFQTGEYEPESFENVWLVAESFEDFIQRLELKK